MSGGGVQIPAAVAACRTLLLWALLCCTHSGRFCANGLLDPTLSKRQLQATTLVNVPQPFERSSGGKPFVGSPPVNSTIYGSSLGPGWAVKSLGSRGIQQQQVAGAVKSGSQAFCATLPAKDVSLFVL